MKGKFFSRNFDRIMRWLLYLLVLTIPIQTLPEAYTIPRFARNVAFVFLVLLVAISLVQFIKRRQIFGRWPAWVKGYLAVACVWPFLCTFIGAVTFPYWDETVNESLRHTWLVIKIAQFYPAVLDNETLLHLKCANSFMLSIVTGLLLPLLGIFFLFVCDVLRQGFSVYFGHSESGSGGIDCRALCVFGDRNSVAFDGE